MRIITLFLICLFPSIVYGNFKSEITSTGSFQFHHDELSGTESHNSSGWDGMTLQDGAVFTKGRYGNAVYIDGVNDWTSASTRGFYPFLNQLTLAFGFNIEDNGNPQDIFTGGHFQFFGFDFTGGRSGAIQVFIWLQKSNDYACNWIFASKAAMVAKLCNKWHTMVYVFDNPRDFRIYFDGVLVQKTGITTAGATNNLISMFGYSANSVASKGRFDELKYKQHEAWTQGQAQKYHNDFMGRHND